MSGRPWMSLGFLVPLLAAFVDGDCYCLRHQRNRHAGAYHRGKPHGYAGP